jgi:hypothetical protein
MMAGSIPPLAQHAAALSGSIGAKDPLPVTMATHISGLVTRPVDEIDAR